MKDEFLPPRHMMLGRGKVIEQALEREGHDIVGAFCGAVVGPFLMIIAKEIIAAHP